MLTEQIDSENSSLKALGTARKCFTIVCWQPFWCSSPGQIQRSPDAFPDTSLVGKLILKAYLVASRFKGADLTTLAFRNVVEFDRYQAVMELAIFFAFNITLLEAHFL